METEYSWQTVKSGGYQRDPTLRRYGWWVTLAVLLSILLHLGLYMVFNNIEVIQFVPGYEKVIQLPVSRDQTVIDDETWKRLLQEESPRADVQNPPKEEVVYDEAPPDLPDVTETIKLTPATDVVQNLFSAADVPPAPAALSMPDLGKSLDLDLTAKTTAAEVKAQLDKATQTAAASQPTIYVDEARQVGVDTDALVEQMTKQVGGAAGKAIGSKFSSLDTLLGEGIQTPSAEVLIPTDLLFDVGAYAVREEAKLSLMKLGMLILANRDATFVFKGFTDSIPFRSAPDRVGPRNNEELSLARAEAVRSWLVLQLGLDGYDLQAAGFGAANPLVPPAVTVEQARVQEAINRRVEVEIILRTPAKAVRAKPIGP